MSQFISVSTIENSSNLKYINQIQQILFGVLQSTYLSDSWILELEGMSGKKYRDFINQLLSTLSPTRYLEIGVWQGSTLCAALNNNTVTATAIDNWSQFNGPRDKFFGNLRRVQGNSNTLVLEQDFRKINYSLLPKHNVYFFDGPHDHQDHYDALSVPMDALEDEFVLIVDDWNSLTVQQGTLAALNDFKFKYQGFTILTTTDGSYPDINMQNSDWHNGYFIASISKTA